MNKTATLFALALGAISLAFTPIKKSEKLSIKPEASKIEWFAEKVTGSHNGTIMLKEGTIEIDGDKVVGGSFVVDMTSINVTDISGDSKNKLEGHLNSPDFFNASEHKTSTFTITSVEPLSGDKVFNHTIKGKLEIKGISHEVSFPASVSIENSKFAAYGELTVDRTKFDIKYGSDSFFDNLGDRAIYDDFKLKISLGASL